MRTNGGDKLLTHGHSDEDHHQTRTSWGFNALGNLLSKVCRRTPLVMLCAVMTLPLVAVAWCAHFKVAAVILLTIAVLVIRSVFASAGFECACWTQDSRQDSWLSVEPIRGAGKLGDLEALGDRPAISLAGPGLLRKACCGVPAFVLFSMMVALAATAWWSQTVFYVATAVLTIFVLTWSTGLAIFMSVGAWSMRCDTAKDWDTLFSDLPDRHEVMHLVLLPNYKEDEQMMEDTLQNIGRSSIARENVRVVLAMEEREGAAGKAKAERLMEKCGSLFADICATYHPAGIQGEIAGKSSNTQWAFKTALSRYSEELERMDKSKVFITVGDADTLWHPQFFNALAYQALQLPLEKRRWTVWQPPVLLLRNLFSVPGPTRVSAFGTLMFELGGLAGQKFGSHFSFSAYSMSLALASHEDVNGWDTDVIAEDHHMFAKCYFASMWDTLEGSSDAKPIVEPKLQLSPVWLPAVSYLVETTDGWWASCKARFQQARRHSQGIAELSYVLLQYAELIRATGFFNLPFRTHRGILAIAWKMYFVHIVSPVQAFALVVAAVAVMPEVIRWIWAGSLTSLVQKVFVEGLAALGSELSAQLGYRALFTAFGPLPPVAMLSAITIYYVVRDTLEGRYYKMCQPSSPSNKESSATAGAPSGILGVENINSSWWRRPWLAARIQWDMALLAEPTIMVYGLLPVILAAWSLLCNGTKFEYIVAAKPN